MRFKEANEERLERTGFGDVPNQTASVPLGDMLSQLNTIAAALFRVGHILEQADPDPLARNPLTYLFDDLEVALGRGLEIVGRDSIFVVQTRRGNRFKDATAAVSLEAAFFAARMEAFHMLPEPPVEHNLEKIKEWFDGRPNPDDCRAVSEQPNLWSKMPVPAGCIGAWKFRSQFLNLRIVQRHHSVARTDIDIRPDLWSPEAKRRHAVS